MAGETPAINPDVPPSGDGCIECLATSGWWFHLRRCALCGHVGCCESSPSQHASQHARELGHPIVQSFEPGERWFWDYAASAFLRGPELAPPDSRPVEQGSPAPRHLVPSDWQEKLHPPVTGENPQHG
ncbi:UBP-type zinc finger domain-containing protein [Diaminobutyricimonas sp. TR449]|uniref:UBP-type zinc finger domain-containing protein n=1 Tax=Diaminobutyricimonas sp. TR449 TaxID=2708076 RepID=UPI00141D9CD0|nr:UBP-type zinc finger domain-containing protein [Diaminobutyricimonas sp. TR449]